MTLAFEFVHKMQTPDREILQRKAMHRHSLPVRNYLTKIHLPTLTEECLQEEFNKVDPSARADESTFRHLGILPAEFFEGSTRREKLLNRAIAGVASLNNMAPNDTFVVKTSDDEDDILQVKCVQCDETLQSRDCAVVARAMRRHVTICPRRKHCINCNIDFSSIGLRGHSRVFHEASCYTEDQFQQTLDWIDSAGLKSIDGKANQDLFGFARSGYPKAGPDYTKEECTKKYGYLYGKLIGTKEHNVIDHPRYHRLLAAVNSIRCRHGDKPLANKFVIANR